MADAAEVARQEKVARAKALLNKKKKAAKKAKAETQSEASSVAAATPSLDDVASPRVSVDGGDDRPAVEEPVATPAPTEATEPTISASPLRSDEVVAEPLAEQQEEKDALQPSSLTPEPEPQTAAPEPSAGEPAAVAVAKEGEAPAAEEETTPALPSPPAAAAAAAPASTPPVPEASPTQETTELDSLRSTVDAQKQTISLLTAEKTQQAAQLDLLDHAQADLAKRTDELSDSRSTVGRLEVRVASLEGERKDLYAQVEKLTERAKELQAAEGFRSEVAKLKKSEASLQQRIADAEARKRADDEKEGGKVKELEETLERMRERESGLEREVGRLKSAHQALESAHQTSRASLSSTKETLAKLESAHATVAADLETLRVSHTAAEADNAALTATNADLTTQLEALRSSSTESSAEAAALQKSLDEALAAQRTSEGEHKAVDGKHQALTKRFDALQSENSNLLTQLEEMQTKVVDIQRERVELEQKTATLERDLRDARATATQSTESLAKHEAALKAAESKQQQVESRVTELTAELASMTTENEASLHSIQSLERDRSDLRRVTSTTRKEADDTLALLESERAKNESLTSELTVIDELKVSVSAEGEKRVAAEASLAEVNEEIGRLKDEVASLHEAAAARDKAAEEQMAKQQDGSRAFDEERITSLQNQHALELSTAKGQIRKLESAVFEAEKANSTSQLKLHELQAEMDTLRTNLAQSARTLSLPVSTGSSAAASPSRASSTNPFDHLSARPVDADLPAASRHARKVSLSMLKARMETGPGGGPRKVSTGALSSMTVDEEDESGPSLSTAAASAAQLVAAQAAVNGSGGKGPRMVTHQFSDRDGIIWCSCCEADLIVI